MRTVQLANGMVEVTFLWSTDRGTCHDCGLPAAYKLVGYKDWEPASVLRCSLCAALLASHGEQIVALEDEQCPECEVYRPMDENPVCNSCGHTVEEIIHPSFR